MKNKLILILTVLIFSAAAAALAQAPAVIVEYYENLSGEMYVRTPDGAEYNVDQFGFGAELPVGTTLFTLDGDYAELRLDPSGSIIKISENTNFRVDGLQGRDGSSENTFNVAVGKFKAVVARRDGGRYTFRGPTAVCGVRGTTIIRWTLPGKRDLLYMLGGAADYTNQAGQTIRLSAGQAADALATQFVAFTPPPDLKGELERGMDFIRLRVQDVFGYEEAAAEAPKEEEKVAEAVEQPAEVEKPEEEKKAEAETPEWLEKMMNFLGLELGTTTIEDETWAKAVFLPRFTLGKLKVALYLPIIYQEDMLDASTWYRPEGNDEWSFGTDQGGWQEITLDALEDLFLKIRYVQWGDNRDPFFFKLGNLDNFTIGHGSIMRGYANDFNFPAERKLGLNLGLNKEKGGVELMVNDAAYPQIFGGRLHYRPFAPGFKLGFGLTALADINPEQVPYGGTALYGQPMFFNAGLDLDQPIIERDALQVILFADLASMIPYFREDPTYIVVPGLTTPGLAMDAVWYDGRPKNWGVDAGIMGKLLIIDYRLEFLYSDGIYRPGFYNTLYDLQSPAKVKDLVDYLSDPDDPDNDRQRMGIYGELGYTWEKIFYISGGYNWNWPVNPAGASEWEKDWFWLEVGLFKDLLPVYGHVALSREGLVAPLVNGEDVDFFDENLVLSGEIVYPLSPILEIALNVSSNVFGGQWYPSVSILTRLNN